MVRALLISALEAALALGLLVAPPLSGAQSAQTQQETIKVNAHAVGTSFPHYWDQMFGSGHATLAMRQSYRQDMVGVKKVTDFQYVRFHGILDDENGVYGTDAKGDPLYNWTYVDQYLSTTGY